MTNTHTVSEHARLRGVTLTYVYSQLRAGRIPGAKKVGRTWRLPAQANQTQGRGVGADGTMTKT